SRRRFVMPINDSRGRKLVLSSLALFLLASGAILPAKAQSQLNSAPQRRTTTITGPEMQRAPAPVAGDSNLYCAGFVRLESFNNRGQIVGGPQEQEKFLYSQGAFVYLNSGSQQGIREGDEFLVVRPFGKVGHVYKQKHGPVGVYFRELGR